MILRFDMAPRNGQRSILQYMVPWLSNIELVDECHPPPSGPAHPPPDYPLEEDEDDEGNIGLRGSGWGSLEGTKVVLHNLLYITAKVNAKAVYMYMQVHVTIMLVKPQLLSVHVHVHMYYTIHVHVRY